jgi:putative heme-binding domain-containing protein
VFASQQCGRCHRVGDGGGRLGPDLSRIGASRSPSALAREIRTPSEWIAPGYESVTLVVKDGQKFRAVKKNEDVFSIQVMDTQERIQGYRRSELQDVVYEKASLMPAYGSERLSEGDLADLIAYLSTLRSAKETSQQSGASTVTYQDLLDGLKDPTKWLTYSGRTTAIVIVR